jgi:hypothetical protein
VTRAHNFHPEILNDDQKAALLCLGNALKETDYYLAGGTGLSLHLGHRLSIDLDWFTPELNNPESLFRRLSAADISFTVTSIALETVYVILNNVQISFIGYNYPLIEPRVFWPAYGCYLASIADIACMKLASLASRGSRKDFVDLHRLLSDFYSLETLLKFYKKKYKKRDIGHVVRSLVYFQDAEAEPPVRMVKSVDWDKLKLDFERWVKEIPLLAVD